MTEKPIKKIPEEFRCGYCDARIIAEQFEEHWARVVGVRFCRLRPELPAIPFRLVAA